MVPLTSVLFCLVAQKIKGRENKIMFTVKSVLFSRFIKWVIVIVCSYQLEALESGIKQNTIVFLETGSGKTLIAIMLLRSYAHLLRKPSPFVAVFLVPKVVLVNQVCCQSLHEYNIYYFLS